MFTGADVKGSGGLSHICGAADITQTTMFENALDLCVKTITDVRQMENAIILWFGLTLLCV